MKKIYLIEDHDQALKVWRQKKIKGLDLVHLDAHIDFDLPASRPVEKILKEATSLKELKNGLEHSLAFMRFEKDFDKQTHIGNYIYPAIDEGIVRNFYWVIPGKEKEFRRSYKTLKKIIKDTLKNFPLKTKICKKKSIISIRLLDKNLIICNLKSLPIFKQSVLLDIDTDFLVIDSLLNSDNTINIGKRKPWILPKSLVGLLKNKIKKPKVITIAYSVNGGWTPIRYKHLGDEMAYYFAPRKFKNHFKNSLKTAGYFNLFNSTGKKEYYQKAVNLNPAYRVLDNNYGPLYLSLGKLSPAKNEFLKILKADPKNSASLSGLGNISLERKNFKKAKEYFSSILKSKDNRLFSKEKKQSLLGLAKAEFNLRNFYASKKLLYRYQTLEPLNPEGYYLLARIYEKEKKIQRSAKFYKDAFSLGFGNNLELIYRLLKISKHIAEKEAIIKYIVIKYDNFKRVFTKILRMAKNIKRLDRIKKKMASIEEMLENRYAKK